LIPLIGLWAFFTARGYLAFGACLKPSGKFFRRELTGCGMLSEAPGMMKKSVQVGDVWHI
jgi:hypothetical protein